MPPNPPPHTHTPRHPWSTAYTGQGLTSQGHDPKRPVGAVVVMNLNWDYTQSLKDKYMKSSLKRTWEIVWSELKKNFCCCLYFMWTTGDGGTLKDDCSSIESSFRKTKKQSRNCASLKQTCFRTSIKEMPTLQTSAWIPYCSPDILSGWNRTVEKQKSKIRNLD